MSDGAPESSSSPPIPRDPAEDGRADDGVAPSAGAAALVDDLERGVLPTENAEAASGSELVRSGGVVALGTGLSRLTGFLRTIVQAAALGGVVNDVYNAANVAPNLVYDLLLGGVLAATLVPVFVGNLAKRDDRANEAVFWTLGVALVVVTAVAMLLIPLLTIIYSKNDEQRPLIAALLVMFIPQVFFYGLITLMSGLLNGHRRFAAAAFAPVINNIVLIAVFGAFARSVDADASLTDLSANRTLLVLLGIGTTLGIALQAAVLVPAVRRAHIPLRFRFEPRHQSVRSVVRLSGWTFGYVVANIATVGTVFALAQSASQPDGTTTAYAFAYQFFQLPYGLLAVSVITAFLPELSRLAAIGDHVQLGDRFVTAIRLTALVVIPTTIGYVFFARPLCVVVFEHGSFSHESALATGDALVAFSVGLPSFCLYLLTMRGFYAFKDTRRPFYINLGDCALNLVLAVALVGTFHAAGLAAAFALSYVVFAVVAVVVYQRRVGGLPWRASAGSFWRMGVAAAVMAVALWPIAVLVGSDEPAGALVRVGVGVVVGAVVYLGACALLRLPDLHQVYALVRRRGSGASA